MRNSPEPGADTESMSEISIFDESYRRRTPWRPAALKTATPGTEQTTAANSVTSVAPSLDTALLAILDAPLQNGEPARMGFARKEQELVAAFAALPVVDQIALAKRLSNARAGDRLAEAFGRLTVDRRERLIQFLEDARRRAALAKGKR